MNVNPLRRAIKKFIDIDNEVISLVPQGKKVVKPGGIYDASGDRTPRVPQKFNIVPYGGKFFTVENGDLRTYFEVTGAWDAEIEIGDSWTKDGVTYRIMAVMPDDRFEKRCLAVALTKEASYG